MDNKINLDPQQIQQMILMLQSMLPSQNDSETQTETQPAKKNRKTSGTQTTKKVSNNKFDSMMEKRMHKEDIEIDKKLIVQPPVPRARPFNMVSVTCRVCGKKETVNPVLITDSIDRYKCNRCSGAAG